MSAPPEAYEALEEAIRQLTAAQLDEEGDPETVTDAVLLVGSQGYDSDGDRWGRIAVYPRHGSQPYYITEGLLHSALTAVSTASAKGSE